jgi:8-oxo-dGTP pyrophosphatase MutT (NUDIX family)
MPSAKYYNCVKIRNNIVTAFIEYRGKVLLLRRSQRVKSMKGKWAGVSGYIEAYERPLVRAFKEIEEETGLTHKNVRILKEGRPLEASDDERPDTMLWVVHPFYFRTNSNAVNLDWEHDQYRWVNPNEIENLATVPRLKEALDRVYPGISDSFEQK